MNSQNHKKRLWLITATIVSILLAITCTIAQEEIPITTSSDEALELFRKGRDLWEKGIQECTQYFEKAIAKDSTFAMAYYFLAFSRYDLDKLFAYLNKAVSLVDKVSEGEKIILLATQAEFINDNPTKAKELYQKLVETYPQDKRAHEAFGFCYFRTREYGEAIDEYKKAIEIDPDFASPYNPMGYCYSYLGNYDEAEKVLKKYAELIPNAANPHDSYGEILMKQGKFDESIDAYKKALSLDPDFLAAHIGLGTNLIFKGKADEGRKEFQKFYNMAHDDGERQYVIQAIAASYIYEGKFEKAMQELQELHSIVEKNNNLIEMAYSVNLMADLLLETGKLVEAEMKYLKSVELIEKSEIASKEQKNDVKQGLLFDEAHIALKKDDVITAKAKADEYRKQIEIDNNPLEMQTSHELVGMIALHEKRYDDALQELQQANQRNPRNLCRMAKAYQGKGDKVKAKEFWTKAANFNEISINYAYIHNKAKKKLAEM